MIARISLPCLLVAFACGIQSMAAAPADKSSYKFMKDVPSAGDSEKGLAQHGVLDEEVFFSTDPEYAGLRVFDDNWQEVPFIVRTVHETRKIESEERIPLKRTTFSQTENGIEVVYQVATGSAIQPVALTIGTGQKNYEKYFSILASPNGVAWDMWVTNQPIFDYSRFMDVRNNRLDFHGGDTRFFKVLISNITESKESPLTQVTRDTRGGATYSEVEMKSLMREDFRIDDLAIWQRVQHEVTGAPVIRSYEAGILSSTNLADKKTSQVIIETRRAPITRLTLETQAANFTRQVDLEGSDTLGQWSSIAQGTISRISLTGLSRESLALPISAHRCRYYRLTIHNLDSLPLPIHAVKASGETHELVCLNMTSQRYRALYGTAMPVKAVYDIANELAQAPSGPRSFTLGPQQANPLYVAGASTSTSAISGKTWLTIAIVLTVAVLVWVVARSAKSLEER